MAQTIKIKRSTSTSAPGSLGAGELAYSSDSNKLFIGHPSSSAVTAIGGALYVEMLDHSAGTLAASSAIIVDSDSKIDQLKTGNIVVTGSYAGCKVCLPENSSWTTGLSATNGWADMFAAYAGSGVPRNSDPGCAQEGVMNGSSGTFKCVFGTESSSNGNGKILVRFKLTSGQSITNIKFSPT